MKTSKQLKDIFINRSISSYREHYEGLAFSKFVREKIYKGHTCKDRLCMTFKLNPLKFDGLQSQLPKKSKIVWADLEAFMKIDSSQADRRIDSRFEWFRVELNNLLDAE